MRLRDGWALALTALLVIAGILHFVSPESFESIVPRLLPGSGRFWTYVSGVAEIVIGIGVAVPATRRVAALGAAILFVCVFPANIQNAVDASSRATSEFAITLLRLPLQIPLVWWAWHVRQRSSTAAPSRISTGAPRRARQSGPD
jgi:uncharacterized membrane protein